MTFGCVAFGDDHPRRTTVETGRVASRDGAVLAEDWFEPCQRVNRGVGTIGFVARETHRSLAAGTLERDDFPVEITRGLRRATHVGLATWVGLLLGTVLKLALAFAMLGLFVLAWWL